MLKRVIKIIFWIAFVANNKNNQGKFKEFDCTLHMII